MDKLINPKDYEVYNLCIPLKKLHRGNIKKYIYGELEKLHPCFSDKDAVDCKFHVGKKGLEANVTVLEKLTLAEYKSRYPKAVLCTEKGKKVFLKSWQKKNTLFLICTGCVIFLCSFFCFKRTAVKSARNILPVSSEKFQEIKRIPEKSCLECFFENAANSGGEIKSLDWSLSLQKGNVVESIGSVMTGGNPLSFYEETDSAVQKENRFISDVSYKNGEENYSFKNEKIFPLASEVYNTGFSVEERKAFIREIQQYLASRNCFTEKEDFFGKEFLYRTSFECENLDYFKTDSEEIVFSASEYFLSQCSIQKKANNKFKCVLTFTDSWLCPFKNDLSEIIYKNAGLFQQIRTDVSLPEKSNVQEVVLKKENGNQKKVGVITHGNSEKKYFYKNEKGRIVHEEF